MRRGSYLGQLYDALLTPDNQYHVSGRTCQSGGHLAARLPWQRQSWNTIIVIRAELCTSDSEYWRRVFQRVYRVIVRRAEEFMDWCGRQQDGAWWVLIPDLENIITSSFCQVGNRAVCYNENLEYSLVKSKGEHYIVGTDLLSHPGENV